MWKPSPPRPRIFPRTWNKRLSLPVLTVSPMVLGLRRRGGYVGAGAREVLFTAQLRVRYRSGQDPDTLERTIAAEGRRAARELYQELARAIDDESVGASRGTRQRVEARWVATWVGRVRLRRYRVKTDSGTFHPLDERLQLDRAEASQALRASAGELANLGLSTRQISAVLTLFTGSALPRQTVWRMLRSD
jgi:hypothetical protein